MVTKKNQFEVLLRRLILSPAPKEFTFWRDEKIKEIYKYLPNKLTFLITVVLAEISMEQL